MICDSYVRPAVLVRICDECNYGSYEVRLQRSRVLRLPVHDLVAILPRALRDSYYRVVVSFAVGLGYQTPITAENAHSRKRM